MYALSRGILGVAAAALLVACSDASRSTSPAVASRDFSARTEAGETNHIVSMHDACDPATFDAALQDPSACLRDGGVTFQEFVAQLQKHQQAGAWHFAQKVPSAPLLFTLIAPSSIFTGAL